MGRAGEAALRQFIFTLIHQVAHQSSQAVTTRELPSIFVTYNILFFYSTPLVTAVTITEWKSLNKGLSVIASSIAFVYTDLTIHMKQPTTP